MSRFTVTWSPDAGERLTETWLNSSDRAAVTAAAAQIDRLLRDAPLFNGTQIAEGLWGLSEPPLRVLFNVEEADCRVEVVWVKTVED